MRARATTNDGHAASATGSRSTAAPRAWRLLRGPFLALGLLAALVVGLELLLRALGIGAPPSDVLRVPGQRVPDTALTLWDPDLFYVLRPGAAMFGSYHVNSLGYRGPDLTRERAPGTLRVACLGDSSTFGLGVPDDRTWPFQLERLLDGLLEGELDAECLNAGVPGYSTEQNKRQFLRRVLPLQPDLVVTCPTAQNDTSLRGNDGDASVLDENSELLVRLEQMHLARLLGLRRSETSFRASGNLELGDAGARARCTPEEFRENLEAITRAARREGLGIVHVVTPHSPALVARLPDLGASEELVLAMARDEGVPAADVRDDFAAFAPMPMFSDRIHFVPLGQQLIAIEAASVLIGLPPLAGPPADATGESRDRGAAVAGISRARADFLRAWRTGRSEGLSGGKGIAGLLAGPGAPPRLLALLGAALGAPQEEAVLPAWLAGGAAPPDDFLDHDPLVGRRRSPYGSGVLALAEARLRAAGKPARAAEAAARRAEIERFVHPQDPLLRWAGGAEALAAADAGRLALLRALVAFDAAIGAEPPPRDLRAARGHAALVDGRVGDALTDLDAALALHPGHGEARYHRAFALRRSRRNVEAVESFRALVASEPDSALGQFIAGMLHHEAGEAAAAEPLLRNAIALDGTLARARYLLARVLIDRGALDEAQRQLLTAAVIMTDPVDVLPMLREIEARRAAEGLPAPDPATLSGPDWAMPAGG